MKSLTAIKRSRAAPLRWLCAIYWSIKNTLLYRTPVRIYQSSAGKFFNKRSDAVFVSPEVHAISYEAVAANVQDYWLHKFGVSEGDIVVDLGAGIGDEATVFSRLVGPSGKVIAVEAHPNTYKCLELAVELNALANVTPVNCAVLDVPGEFAMDSGANYLLGRIVGGGGWDVMVPATTIDKLLEDLEIDHVDLMKINIEGAEVAALAGCVERMENISRIVVSCHDFIADADPTMESMRTFRAVTRVLQSKGFSVSFRPDDERPWVRYYVYAERHRLSGDGSLPAKAS